MKMKKSSWRPKPSTKKKLGLTYILNFYDCYLREKSLEKVAAAFGVVPSNIQDKIGRYPVLEKVIQIANKNRSKGILKEYVLRNLSKPARKLWAHIQKNAQTIEELNNLFSGRPKFLRQELFVYAMLSSGFNASAAMRMVGVTKRQLDHWREDLRFLELLEEVHMHKKNFFESQMIGLVAEGHPGATIHVNKTINADRGYGDKMELKHSGEISGGDQIKIEDLPLDLETKKKVLDALREYKETKALEAAKPVHKALPPIKNLDNMDESENDNAS